jgi:hypothetical protein
VAAAGLATDSVETLKIVNGNVTFAKIENLAGLSVLGRSASTSGVSANITASTDHHVLRRSGTALGFGLITDDNISTTTAISTSKLGAGAILQVVQVVKTDSYSETLATGAISDDIPGFSVSITPQKTSSKILVSYSLQLGGSSGRSFNPILHRGGSALAAATGDAAGNRRRVTSGGSTNIGVSTTSMEFLDSPNTTSSVTYTLRIHNGRGESTSYGVNQRTPSDDNNETTVERSISTFTLMEVAA